MGSQVSFECKECRTVFAKGESTYGHDCEKCWDVFMVLVHKSNGQVVVKTYDAFKAHGGFTMYWGRTWEPIKARSVEEARELACKKYEHASAYQFQRRDD